MSYYWGKIEEILIGSTIKELKQIDSDQIDFFTDKGVFKMRCAGDCGSEGWIESIDCPENLIDAKIIKIEEITGQDLPGTRQEYDLVYFLKIKTDKGYVTIDYRNSSNGYYGTHLDWSFEPGKGYESYGLIKFTD